MWYLRDKGGLKTQVHHESQEGIHDLSEQVHILLTLGLWKQNKVINDLPAACHGHLFPLAMVSVSLTLPKIVSVMNLSDVGRSETGLQHRVCGASCRMSYVVCPGFKLQMELLKWVLKPAPQKTLQTSPGWKRLDLEDSVRPAAHQTYCYRRGKPLAPAPSNRIFGKAR